jgi:hypothetical protein
MTNSDFLKQSKILLRRIAKQRLWLLGHQKSHVSNSFATQEIRNLENAISIIKDAPRMKAYLERKKELLHVLIPSKNKIYHTKLKQLIESDII